jgi:hypothetical protein
MESYQTWITNCPADDAFERLVRYCHEDPDGSYTIGPPHETVSFCQNGSYIYYSGIEIISDRSRGCTVSELESMDYRGIYKCLPTNPTKVDI